MIFILDEETDLLNAEENPQIEKYNVIHNFIIFTNTRCSKYDARAFGT